MSITTLGMLIHLTLNVTVIYDRMGKPKHLRRHKWRGKHQKPNPIWLELRLIPAIMVTAGLWAGVADALPPVDIVPIIFEPSPWHLPWWRIIA